MSSEVCRICGNYHLSTTCPTMSNIQLPAYSEIVKANTKTPDEIVEMWVNGNKKDAIAETLKLPRHKVMEMVIALQMWNDDPYYFIEMLKDAENG